MRTFAIVGNLLAIAWNALWIIFYTTQGSPWALFHIPFVPYHIWLFRLAWEDR
jgi:hypothetical protein